MPPTPSLESPATTAGWFATNRRDGARLLSIALVITGAGLVRIDHPVGRMVAAIAGMISLAWWTRYRRLTH